MTAERTLTLDDALSIRRIHVPWGMDNRLALSGDGRFAACVLQHAGAGQFAWRVAVVDLTTGETLELNAPPLDLWGPAWSPTGDCLACLGAEASRNESGGGLPPTARLYLWRPGDAGVRALPGTVRGTPRVVWAEDGRHILAPTPPPRSEAEPSVRVFAARGAPLPLRTAAIVSIDVVTGPAAHRSPARSRFRCIRPRAATPSCGANARRAGRLPWRAARPSITPCTSTTPVGTTPF